jgi:hypothetical protein
MRAFFGSNSASDEKYTESKLMMDQGMIGSLKIGRDRDRD